MHQLIGVDFDKCCGCNRCIRTCPIEEANIIFREGNEIKIKLDPEKCIACGACVQACQHNARFFTDDLERFFSDLKQGVPISVIMAPAAKTNFNHTRRLITWLKNQGVRSVFDVSLGADICTWAHIRYLQKNPGAKIITQPCPAIVNYVTKHKSESADHLSPIHSPMLCTAIYMQKVAGISDRIAAISPCVAKASEFEQTGIVGYNVTFDKLINYLTSQGVKLPAEEGDFDHAEAGMGRIYSKPGGLKENIEYYIGKNVFVEKSEGQSVVYKALDRYASESPENLPDVFDVLNCAEGCNQGTGCKQNWTDFELNKRMDNERQRAIHHSNYERPDELLTQHDQTLRVQDFIRTYPQQRVATIPYTEADVQQAFAAMGKTTQIDQTFDCFSCGSETCAEMAVRIAKGLNIPENCVQKAKLDVIADQNALLEEKKKTAEYIEKIVTEISAIKAIKKLSDQISQNIGSIEYALNSFSAMSKTINKLSLQTNLISLNASIESAKAGANGAAFGVVANEIRRLAISTKESVETSNADFVKASESLSDIVRLFEQFGGMIDSTYKNIEAINQGMEV